MKTKEVWKGIDPFGISRPMPEKPIHISELRTKLMLCPDCQKEVSTSAASCPHCGRKLKGEQTAIGLLAAIIIGLIIAYFLFGGL